MILQTMTVTIQRNMLKWLFPVICIFCTNSVLAIETNKGIQHEKINLSESEAISVDTTDFSVLSQKELKKELKKLKKTNRELYKKVKSEFLKENAIVIVAAVIVTTIAASLLGALAGCVIYSLEP